jgi:hypothetical protein
MKLESSQITVKKLLRRSTPVTSFLNRSGTNAATQSKKVRLRATYNHPETSVQTDSVNEQYEKKAWRNLKKAHVRSVELKRRWGRHAAGSNMIILHH